MTDPQVVTLAEHDEVEAVEILDPEAAAGGEGWSGARGQDQRVVEERRRHHEGIGHGQHDEREVDLAGGDLGHQLVRAGLDDREVDAGMALVELDEGGRQGARDQAGRGADGETAAGHARERAGLGAGGLDVGQDALHEGEQRLAVGGEGDRALAGAPVEERHAELVLEQADLAAQAGLGQVQAGGGPGEALLLGDGEGVGQLVQLHMGDLLFRAYRSENDALYVFDVRVGRS